MMNPIRQKAWEGQAVMAVQRMNPNREGGRRYTAEFEIRELA